MVTVYASPLRRRYNAPVLSGAFVFVALGWISMIIFAFLISFFSGQMWVKENTYREQPDVAFIKSLALKVQGMRGGVPFHAVYSTVPSINNLAGADLRVPIITSSVSDYNVDNIADAIRINVTFPLTSDEHVMGVQGVYAFSYKLSNFIRLDMEAPIALSYSSGVPCRALHVDGRLALKLANPLPYIPQVRGIEVAPILSVSREYTAPEAAFPALIERVSNRNDSVTLDPSTSSWETAYATCGNACAFTVALNIRITPEKVHPSPLCLSPHRLPVLTGSIHPFLLPTGFFASCIIRVRSIASSSPVHRAPSNSLTSCVSLCPGQLHPAIHRGCQVQLDPVSRHPCLPLHLRPPPH